MKVFTDDSGGPAFPSGDGPYGGGPNHANGMLLRDYFAAQFMASAFERGSKATERDIKELFGDDRNNITREDIAAALAYQMADAMIARRSR